MAHTESILRRDTLSDVHPVAAPVRTPVRAARRSFIKRVWQWHSWLGLGCGLGLIVIGVTGSLLVFHGEIDAWRFPALLRAQPKAGGRLPYDVLWASLRRTLPPTATITSWMPALEPGRTDAVFLLRHPGEEEPSFVHVDPYTAQVRGVPVEYDHTLTGWLLDLHFSFLGGTTGTFVAGLLALGLLALGGSGVWLYRGFWRSFFTLRWRRSARIFFSDVHKMVGISSVAFNLVLGLTGAWWNLTSVYGKWLAPAAAAAPANLTPPPAFGFAEPGSPGGLSLDALLAQAERTLPGYQLTFLTLPADRTGTITCFGRVPTPGNPLRGDYGSRLGFDAGTGTLQEIVDVRKAGLWGKIEDSFALLHYGTFGAAFGPGWALVTKALWTVLGLSPGLLALSGFLIWRSRHRRMVRPIASGSSEG